MYRILINDNEYLLNCDGGGLGLLLTLGKVYRNKSSARRRAECCVSQVEMKYE